MRPLHEARQRWRAIFVPDAQRSTLRERGGACEGEGGGLRSVCWKIWLLFPDFDPSTYSKTLRAERSAYEALRESYVLPFESGEGFADGAGDPLAEDEANPWTRYRKDEELRKEIVQDVERCMPDLDYFRDAAVQKSLLDILFVYCKLNEDLGYRQGMHEIVAVILWVLSGDAISPDQEAEEEEEEGDKLEGGQEDIMKEVLDAKYIDHDVFSLFQVIMRSAKAWYELGEEGEGGKRGRADGSGRGRPPIVEKSRHIHEVLLMQVDPELGDHLKALDVLPQVFLIRWIRLLFGREFPLADLLEVWDSLFAEDPNLVLVDYICVAMLLRIRWPLIEADYSTALTLVLRYPSPPTPHTFVADAIHLRSNLTLAGGRHIITQYSRREPATPKPPRQQQELPSRVATTRTKSPLGSPTRFIPGVQLDSVISDVARGVLDRGEKWGVNRAVGRAVVEVKKNVQGFQQQQQVQWGEASKELAREEELVRKSRALSKRLKQDEERRKQLEKMVGLSIEALEQEPLDPVGRQTAIERLRHVRACLADGTKALDVTLLENVMPSTPTTPTVLGKAPPPAYRRSSSAVLAASPLNPVSPLSATIMAKTPSSPPGGFVKTSFKNNSDPDFLTHKPRSSLAQSSFAWMLGDDPAVKAKTGFVASGGRKGSGAEAGRGVGGEEVGSERGDEGFDLGNMKTRL